MKPVRRISVSSAISVVFTPKAHCNCAKSPLCSFEAQESSAWHCFHCKTLSHVFHFRYTCAFLPSRIPTVEMEHPPSDLLKWGWAEMLKKMLALQLLESVVLVDHPTLQTVVNMGPLFLHLIAKTQICCQYFILIQDVLPARGVF